jgi:hypothetical protein
MSMMILWIDERAKVEQSPFCPYGQILCFNIKKFYFVLESIQNQYFDVSFLYV